MYSGVPLNLQIPPTKRMFKLSKDAYEFEGIIPLSQFLEDISEGHFCGKDEDDPTFVWCSDTHQLIGKSFTGNDLRNKKEKIPKWATQVIYVTK